MKEAERTDKFAHVIFSENKIEIEKLTPRAIIPNDSKLFAQADLDKTITHFITSDLRSKVTLELLRKVVTPKFSIISIDLPYTEAFGILDL